MLGETGTIPSSGCVSQEFHGNGSTFIPVTIHAVGFAQEMITTIATTTTMEAWQKS